MASQKNRKGRAPFALGGQAGAPEISPALLSPVASRRDSRERRLGSPAVLPPLHAAAVDDNTPDRIAKLVHEAGTSVAAKGELARLVARVLTEVLDLTGTGEEELVMEDDPSINGQQAIFTRKK